VEIKRLRGQSTVSELVILPRRLSRLRNEREREVQGFDAVNPIQSSTRLDKRSIDLLEILGSEHCIRTRFPLFAIVRD
jgi:hypothetical protein